LVFLNAKVKITVLFATTTRLLKGQTGASLAERIVKKKIQQRNTYE